MAVFQEATDAFKFAHVTSYVFPQYQSYDYVGDDSGVTCETAAKSLTSV